MSPDLTLVNISLARFSQAPITQGQLTANVIPSAVAANMFWQTCLDEVYASSQWSFATVTLALSSLGEDSTGEWGYIYSRPTLSVGAVYNVFNSGTVEYKEEQEFEVKHIVTLGVSAIYSDLEDAIGEYVYQVTDTTKWSPSFKTALSYRLASDLVMAIAGDAQKSIGFMNMYLGMTGEAKRLDTEKRKVVDEKSRYRESR